MNKPKKIKEAQISKQEIEDFVSSIFAEFKNSVLAGFNLETTNSAEFIFKIEEVL